MVYFPSFQVTGIKLRVKTVYFPSYKEGIKGWCLNNFPLKTNEYKMKKNHFLSPPPNPLLKGGGMSTFAQMRSGASCTETTKLSLV
jgi:hypothetical protein